MESFSYNVEELPLKRAQLLFDQENSLKIKKVFSDLCDRLLNDVTKNIAINERTLFDFGRLIICVIKETDEQPPNSFYALSEYLYDYWRYNLENEQNNERKFSYIRLFQMANVINIHYKDCELRNHAEMALGKYESYDDIICMIKQSPGITHKKMRELLNLPSSELQSKTTTLINDGFLSSKRSGEDKYYMLTNAGEILCRTIKSQKRNSAWSSSWSKERVIILLLVVYYKEEKICSTQLLDILEKITLCSENKINKLLMEYQYMLKNSYFEKMHSDNFISDVMPFYLHNKTYSRLSLENNEKKVHKWKEG